MTPAHSPRYEISCVPKARVDVGKRVEETISPEGWRRARATGPDGGRGFVLVAEDDPLIQEIVRHFLCEEGYHVVTACTVHEALQALRNTRFELVLADTMGVSKTQPSAARWAALEQIRA